MRTGKPDADANAHSYDSTEHRRAEAAQIRLAAIVESSDDAIIGKDLNSIITDWNQGAEKIFGYTAGEMVGASITRLIPTDRQDEENFIMGKIRRGEKVEHFETLRQTKDGRLIHVSVTVAPIKDGDGNVLGALNIARDTTAQKEHEREFARITRLYAALSQVNQAIVWTPTRDELFQKVCNILVERGGFHMAWIGRHDPETREIVPLAVCGDERNYLRSIKIYADDRPEGRGPTGLAFRSGRPYICNDMLNNPVTLPWRSELTRRGFNASAVFPIRPKNEVWGTLTIYSDEPWFFQDQEIALLEKAAGDISFALGNFAEKEARQQVEIVAQSEQLFSATMIESMPGIIYFYDEQGRFLRWNRNFEVVSGYSREEIARMHPLDFFSDPEKTPLKHRIAEVFAKGESSVEASFVAKDGSATPYFFTGRRVVLNGQPCLVGMGVAISERKRAEQALRQSEGKLRALFEQAPLGIAVIDSTTGQFLKINPQYCKIVGYSEAEMLVSNFQQITHPDDLVDDLANMNRLREGVVDAFQIEKRYICKDRSVVWVSLTCVPLGNTPVGEPQHIAMVEDITARKQAENRLAENEQKYRELVELANSIILRWNIKGEITFLNEFGLRFFGYTADEIFGRHVLGTIVPVTESSGRDLQGLMEHVCADPNAFEQNVNENMRRNGERVWISWANRIVRNEQGRMLEILSIGTDITERKQAELELREIKGQLEAVVENLREGLVMADPDGEFLHWNPASLRMLGFTDLEEGARRQHEFGTIFELYTLEGSRLPPDQWPLARVRSGEPIDDLEIRVRRIGSDWERIFSYAGSLVRYTGDRTLAFMTLRDITDRKQSEASLRESLARFHAAARATNDVVWDWDLAASTIWWNENFQTFFGYRAEEIEPGIESWTNRLHPEDKERVVERIHAAVHGTGQMWSDEYRFRRGNGSYAEIFDRGLVLRNEAGLAVRMVGAIQDITERKQAEELLRASEDRYRTLFERAPDGIVIANTEGRYVDANSSICRMLGYARAELIGRHASDIVVPEEIAQIAPALDAIKSESDYHREWQFRRKDGSVFPAEVIATMMPDGTILAMFRDITERKRAELALRVLNQTLELEVAARTSDLQVALVRAEAADRIKSAFLATMSHELRTPLNSIIGFTGIVLQGLAGPLNAEQTKQLGMVRSSSRHLLELINDVLDLSKIEAGQLEVRAEPFNLRDSLERVTALVRPVAEKKSLALSVGAPPELGEMVSDRRRVEQILINLVNNAIKFTEHGSVTVTAERVADYKLSSDATPRPAVRVRVTDTGMGIKPEDLATLFQPFRQLDTGITRQHEGTGLGLAICRRLAALLGGEISARSEWSKGSEFTVTIPLQKPDAP